MRTIAARDRFYDIVKGIGILLVIFFHQFPLLSRFGWVKKAVYGFHMPLFFCISGVFLASTLEKDFRGILAKIWNSFCVPYIFFVILGFVVLPINPRYSLMMPPSQWARALWTIVSGHPFVNPPLWFLCSMSGGLLLLWAANKILRGNKISVFCVITVVTVASRYIPAKELIPVMMPGWSLAAWFMWIGFMGRDVVSWGRIRMNLPLTGFVFIIAGLAELILSRRCPILGMSNHIFGGWGMPVVAILGIVSTLCAAKILDSLIPVWAKILSWIGVNSLFFFCLNFVVRPASIHVLRFVFPCVATDPGVGPMNETYSVFLFAMQLAVISLLVNPTKRLFMIVQNHISKWYNTKYKMLFADNSKRPSDPDDESQNQK